MKNFTLDFEVGFYFRDSVRDILIMMKEAVEDAGGEMKIQEFQEELESRFVVIGYGEPYELKKIMDWTTDWGGEVAEL
jgi:hypothetical protein